MPHREILILVPCHSLEDFPAELADQPAASLLEAFAAAWHPQLIADAGELPKWWRADDPPPPRAEALFFIPKPSIDWVPHGWVDRAREAGGTVVEDLETRAAWLAAALPAEWTAAPESSPADPDLVADFHALGTNWLLIELLTRRMRHFGNIDEPRLKQRTVAAARAVLAHDHEATTTHLRAAFECLLEARERFYPVDCFLLDLCLVVKDEAGAPLKKLLSEAVPSNVMLTTDDLEAIQKADPEFVPLVQAALRDNRLTLVGGEDHEAPTLLRSIESLQWEFEAGLQRWDRLLGERPRVWGRRKFGLTPVLPQLLKKWGYVGALHVVIDDGIYPDHEYSKLRWQGVDGTTIDALSRIPLPADQASTYLRFPVRLAESMDNDQTAGLILARWPGLKNPWLDDLRRSHRYAPCLGHFATLERFFSQVDPPGRLCTYGPGEYFSPTLYMDVAYQVANPVTRHREQRQQRARIDSIRWCAAVAQSIRGQETTPYAERIAELEAELERQDVAPVTAAKLAADSGDDECSQAAAVPRESLDDALMALSAQAGADLASIITSGTAGPRGWLLFNSLSFRRQFPFRDPAGTGGVRLVDLPGSGYAWIDDHPEPVNTPATGSRRSAPQPLAVEGNVLRNEELEVVISEATGGIAQVRYVNRRGNRVSQQLSFRFPKERTIPAGPDGGDSVKTQYGAVRQITLTPRPGLGDAVALESRGEIFDQESSTRLANFVQTTTLYRGLKRIDVEVVLSDVSGPHRDPWNNAFVSRFAWSDSAAVVTRGLLGGVHAKSSERFETGEFIECATESERLTIVPQGLPFHRQTGMRMLDTLLVVEGESSRTFRWTLWIDHDYPEEVSRDALTPPLIVETNSGPPRGGKQGWFFHVDARNVQILGVTGPIRLPVTVAASATDSTEPAGETVQPVSPNSTQRMMVRLMETDGRSRMVRLRTFRTPRAAQKVDFRGTPLANLGLEQDAVVVSLGPHEIAEIAVDY